jgi:predicted  nucleic acid-binding Zn-ribbon protein
MKLTENDMLDIEMRLARGDVRADDVRNLLAALVDMPRLLKNEQTIEVLEDEISSLELTIMSLETQRDGLEDSERELKAEIIKLNKKLEGKSE